MTSQINPIFYCRVTFLYLFSLKKYPFCKGVCNLSGINLIGLPAISKSRKMVGTVLLNRKYPFKSRLFAMLFNSYYFQRKEAVFKPLSSFLFIYRSWNWLVLLLFPYAGSQALTRNKHALLIYVQASYSNDLCMQCCN